MTTPQIHTPAPAPAPDTGYGASTPVLAAAAGDSRVLDTGPPSSVAAAAGDATVRPDRPVMAGRPDEQIVLPVCVRRHPAVTGVGVIR